MAPTKKNEFLDASGSEDEDYDHGDSDDELRKGGGPAPKRRRVYEESDDEDAERQHSSEAADLKPLPQEQSSHATESKTEDGSETGVPARGTKSKGVDTELPDITRTLTRKNLVATDAAIKKSGVVYLSRIPPFMKPTKLRSLLEPYGTINRIFLAPEDPSAHARRVRAGGNKKRSYTEGWVEFVKKKDAKAVCELLNAHIIGGKKGSYYHDDIWNLLYLKGFKWHNLTEQISSENAERTSRMRAEISKSTKENKDFVRNVERAKMLDGIHASKAKKRKVDAEADVDAVVDASAGAAVSEHGADRTRTFKQIQLAKKGSATEEQPERVTRVLSKIF